MGNLNPLFAALVVLTVAAAAAHTATNFYLIPVLGRAFDPFWVPQMLFPPITFGERYKWTLYYSGAVVFKTVHRTIFEDKPYDFRTQVSRTTVLVCVMQQLFALMALGGALAVAAYGVWELWMWWQALPTPAQPKVPERDLESLP